MRSVRRPGGNITGFTQSDYDLGGKWLQLLKEIAPGITAAAIIIPSPISTPLAGYMPSVEDAARSMNISVSVIEIRNLIEIEEKISRLKPHQGVIFQPNNFIAAHRARIIELLTRFRVPGVYFARFFVSDGGLISYGIDQPDLFRQGGGYVDRIPGGRTPPTYRCKRQPSSNWRSTSRPPRHSASKCRRCCSPAPTRSSNEAAAVHHAVLRNCFPLASLAVRPGSNIARNAHFKRITLHARAPVCFIPQSGHAPAPRAPVCFTPQSGHAPARLGEFA